MPKLSSETCKIEPKTFQNRAPEPPKSSPNGTKRGPGRPKNRKRTQIQQRGGYPPDYLRHFGGKCSQHGPKLASQIEPKSIKNRCKNRSKNRCLLKSIFEGILVDFGKDFGTKIDAEIDVIFERRFFDKTSFFLTKNSLF